MGTRWGISDLWLVGKSRLPSLSTWQGEWKDSGKNMEFEFNKSVYELLTSLQSSEYVSGLQYKGTKWIISLCVPTTVIRYDYNHFPDENGASKQTVEGKVTRKWEKQYL